MRIYDIYRVIRNGVFMDLKLVKSISAKSQAHAEKQIREPCVYVAALKLW